MTPKPPLHPRGFSLVEVLMASILVLMVAATSLGLITQSMKATSRAQDRAHANNLQREITSYLRILPWATLSTATAASLQTGLENQFRSELFAFGATSSLSVQSVTMNANSRMVEIALTLTYDGETSPATVRVARRGISP